MKTYAYILFALCTSLSAMYDGSKRLKIDNHIQVQHHPELLKLVDTSPTLKAFQADVGATAQEALEALASHQEIQMVGAYARIKANDALFRDTTSLFAKSWKKLQVSHLAQIANAANKLDIASCKEDMLALACQRVYESRFGTVKQLEHLVPDLYQEAGKRMSLDLLASMGFAVFADSSRRIPNWLEQKGAIAQLVSRNLPFQTITIETTSNCPFLDAAISQNGTSVALAITTEPDVIQTQLLDLATGQKTTVSQFSIDQQPRVFVSPNAKYSCLIDKNGHLWFNNADLDELAFLPFDIPSDVPSLHIQEPVFSADSNVLYISCVEKKQYQLDSQYEEQYHADCESDDEGYQYGATFSLFAFDRNSNECTTAIKKTRCAKQRYHNSLHVSSTGRFCAVVTSATDKQSKKYYDSGNLVYLYDAKTKKIHVICGKKDRGISFDCYNVIFTADESKILIATDDLAMVEDRYYGDLFVIDFTQNVPQTIIVEEHAAQIYTKQLIFRSFNALVHNDLYCVEPLYWIGNLYGYGLHRIQSDALINLTECRTIDAAERPHSNYLTHVSKDGTRLDVRYIRGVQDYLSSLENLNPEQVACVATLGAQYEQRNPAGVAVLAKVRLSQDMKQVFDTLPEALRQRLADCFE